jgi:hypothetical protein
MARWNHDVPWGSLVAHLHLQVHTFGLEGLAVVLDKEAFACVEPLFNAGVGHATLMPRALPMEESASYPSAKETIPLLVQQCIEACAPPARHELWQNIVLSGGTTLMPNFPERLRYELMKLFPDMPPPCIVAENDRGFLSWLGGSLLTDQEYGKSRFVTRETHEGRKQQLLLAQQPSVLLASPLLRSRKASQAFSPQVSPVRIGISESNWETSHPSDWASDWSSAQFPQSALLGSSFVESQLQGPGRRAVSGSSEGTALGIATWPSSQRSSIRRTRVSASSSLTVADVPYTMDLTHLPTTGEVLPAALGFGCDAIGADSGWHSSVAAPTCNAVGLQARPCRPCPKQPASVAFAMLWTMSVSIGACTA